MSETKMRDGGLLVLRLLGATFATHGFTKLFDGGRQNIVELIDSHGLPLPEVLAWAASIAEFLGGILIVVGLYTRVSATFCAITMAVAAFVIHGDNGFGKMELALIYLIGFIAIALVGPGRYSGDAQWRRKN